MRLERASDPTIRWRLALALAPDGKIAVKEMRGIDALQQQERLDASASRFFHWLFIRRRAWPHVWGSELSESSPQVRLSPEHRFAFQRVDGRPVLIWNRVRLPLLQEENGDPAIEVRNRRASG